MMLDPGVSTCVIGFNNIGDYKNQAYINTHGMTQNVRDISAKISYHNGKTMVGHAPVVTHDKNSKIFTLTFVARPGQSTEGRILSPIGTLSIQYIY